MVNKINIFVCNKCNCNYSEYNYFLAYFICLYFLITKKYVKENYKKQLFLIIVYIIILIIHLTIFLFLLYSLDVPCKQYTAPLDGHSKILFLISEKPHRIEKHSIMRFFTGILIKWFLECEFPKLDLMTKVNYRCMTLQYFCTKIVNSGIQEPDNSWKLYVPKCIITIASEILLRTSKLSIMFVGILFYSTYANYYMQIPFMCKIIIWYSCISLNAYHSCDNCNLLLKQL